MTTYLMTGCAGFIGSNMIRYMLRRHSDIRIVNLDALTYAGSLENLETVGEDPRHTFVRGNICDRALVSRLLEEYDPDFVVNFAAESHVDRSIADPTVFLETNVNGTFNLLQCCKESWYDKKTGTCRKDRRFLQISTDEVYGSLCRDGLFSECSPLDPHSPYSASKAAADHFVQAYHDTFGLNTIITRCSNNYGAMQSPEKLIPLIIRNAVAHRPLPIYGDGLQIRDWIYVEDHCRAIDMVLSCGENGEVYNIGGRCERTNISVVKLILAQLSEKLNDPEINDSLIEHMTDRPGHDRRYGIDPSKIMAELGWRPETPFEAGLGKTIDWYLENRSWSERAADRADRFRCGEEAGLCARG